MGYNWANTEDQGSNLVVVTFINYLCILTKKLLKSVVLVFEYTNKGHEVELTLIMRDETVIVFGAYTNQKL